jgi:hypothetical protein
MSISTAKLNDLDHALSRDLALAHTAIRGKSSGDSAPFMGRVFELGVREGDYASTARLAGRIQAAHISEEEYQSLLDERQILLDKKFSGLMTKRESNRLEYVRWSLDRIEDARYGQTLDMLQNAVTQYERLARDITQLEAKLREYSQPSRK